MRVPDELVLRGDSLEVVILPALGARLHRIRAFGHELLRTPDDPRQHAIDPFFWGAYVMAPWCNRATAGAQELAGEQLALASNFPDGSAIHGLVHDAAWDVRADGSLAIRRGGPGQPWPWRFEVGLHPTVDGDTLVLDYRLLNRSGTPMPAGIGLHPWFVRPLELRVPGERLYPSNTESPAEPLPVAGDNDLRALAAPALGLDATWSDLHRPRIELAWPDRGMAAVLEAATSGPDLLVAIASPPTIDAIAVEPQTHGPDPLRRFARQEPDAPHLLAAGDELRLTLTLTVADRRATG